MQDELSTLRHAISAVDDELLQLAAKRLDLARQVGEYKLRHGLAIKDYEVEKQIIERTRDRAKQHGIYTEMAESLVKTLIKYSVIAQDELKRPTQGTAKGKGRRILIVGGGGQMGRWFAHFLDAMGHQVSLWDVHPLPPTEARFPVPPSLAEGLAAVDVAILATPLSATAAIIEQCIPDAGKTAIIDICSLKSPVLPSFRKALAAGCKIASIHPMFGPDIELLADCNIILCEGGDPEALEAVRQILTPTSARLIAVPIDLHDNLMGYVLGAAHLINLVFGSLVAASGLSLGAIQNVAGTTMKNQMAVAMNVARENPDLYFEIQRLNAFTPQLIRSLLATVTRYRDVIAAGSRADFKNLMAAAHGFFTSEGATSKEV